ncbi:MAG TPA: PAS domain S-box protein, partial [Terriglobales bacterium]|nr:PAS domain S-box protein [Terriglobales bacterium]
MQQKNWKEKMGGNPGLIIIGAFIILIILAAADHLLNFPRFLLGVTSEQFEWEEFAFDMASIFCIGLISLTLIRKSARERGKIGQILQVQRDLSLSLSRVVDLKEGLSLCLDSALELSGMDSGGIYLFELPGGPLNLVAQKGLSSDFVKAVSHFEAGSSNVQLVMQGNPDYAQYQKIDLPLTETERNEGLLSLAVIPIKHENQIIGCFNIASHSSDEIPMFARQSLEMIASQTGSSIARLKAEESLHENEERFRQFAENIEQVFWLTDWEAKRLLFVNPAFERLYGRSCQSAYDNRMNWQEVIHPEDRERVRQAFARSADLGQYVEAEYRVVHDDGTIRWVLDRSYPVRDKDGRIYRFASVAEDITDRKRVGEALEYSDKRFRDIAENAQEWIWETDAEGKYTYSSNMVEKILGYTAEEILHKHFYDLFHPEDREALKAAAFAAFAAKQPFKEFINRNLHKNGQIIWLATSGLPLLDDKGNLLGYRGADTDITQRKKAEEALKESEEKFRTLAEESFDSIVIQEKGVILEVNSNFAHTWGYGPSEIIGLSIKDFIAPSSYDTVMRNVLSKSEEPYEALAVKKDGTVFPIEIVGKEITYKGRKARISTARDISERKKSEKKLRESEERYKALFERSLDCVYVHDFDGNFLDANPASLNLLGYTRDEIKSLNFSTILSEDQMPLTFQVIEELRNKGFHEKVIEYRLKHKNGKYVYAETKASIIYRDGKPYAVQGIARDITERKMAEEALELSEKRYRELFDNMGSGVAVYEAINEGRDFRFKSFNRAGEQIEKVEKENLIGKTILEIFSKAENFSLLKVFERIWRTGKPERACTEVIKGQKVIGWRENYIYRLPTGEIVSIFEDVTERKKAEEKLRFSSLYTRGLIEASLDPLVTIGKDGKINDVNKATEEATGIPRSELIGNDFSNYFTEPEKAREGYKLVFEQGYVKDYPLTIRHPSGRTIDVLYNATVFKNEQGEVQGVFAAARDITERKKAEEEIRAERDKLEGVTQNIGVGLAIISKDYRTVWANEV